MSNQTLPQTVDEAIHQLASYYSSRDIDGLLSITSPAFIGCGSGPDDVVLSADELRSTFCRDFSQSERISMVFSDLHVREDIRAAWMLATCTITAEKDKRKISLVGRITAVFRRTIPGWQVAMTHFSMPYPDKERGEVISRS